MVTRPISYIVFLDALQRELFELGTCYDSRVSELGGSCSVLFWDVPEDWALIGGTEKARAKPPIDPVNAKSFYYRLRYHGENGRFEWTKNPKDLIALEEKDPLHCVVCKYNKEKNTAGK